MRSLLIQRPGSALLLLTVILCLPSCATAPSVAQTCPVPPPVPVPVPLGPNLLDLMQSFLDGTVPSLEGFNSTSTPARPEKQ